MAHALTLNNSFLREHRLVLSLSVLAHLTLFVLLSLNLNIFPRPQARPTRLAIQATVVDARAERQRAADLARREREARLEEERRRQQVLDEQRQRDERQRLEQERVQAEQRLAEQQRQEKVEAERRETARRKQEADKARQAQAEQERKQAEVQKLAAADAERKAAAARKSAQSKADLARQMAEEEELAEAADSGELDQYLEVIRQRVRRNWSQPTTAREGDSCDVRVQQIPSGEVVSVVASNCSGDAAFARSVEVAVLRSSPLPLPANPALFERNLLFTFKPEK